jgi:acylphosphatase
MYLHKTSIMQTLTSLTNKTYYELNYLLIIILIYYSLIFELLFVKNRFTAIKLPNLKSNLSDGTVYVYMDAKNPEWTYFTGIITEKSAIGHTVSQMYTTSKTFNEVIFLAIQYLINIILFSSIYTFIE